MKMARLVGCAVPALVLGTAAVHAAPVVTYGFSEYPAVNGQAISNGNSFYVNYPADPVNVNRYDPAYNTPEQRGIFEFDLTTTPKYATVTAATLTFNVSGLTSPSSNGVTTYPTVGLFEYAGDDAIEVSDATQMSGPVVTQQVTGLGSYTVSLPLSELQSLVSSGATALGLLAYQEQTNLQTQIADGAPYAAAPYLQVSYTVPEPATIGLAAAAGFLMLRRRASSN